MAGDKPMFGAARTPPRQVERARLAGSIDDLGRIYSRRNRGSRKMGTFERHLVQHRSMPKVQKADLVCIRSSHDKDRPKRHSVEIGAVDRDRWSWKPRADFEQTYFGDLDSYEGRSKTFQASRERLHEIFEHNRYLRRKFFADMPGSSVPDLKFGGSNAGTGFGSTETVTSQSNHSGESSNGRKSRNDFNSDTPDSVQLKETSRSYEVLTDLNGEVKVHESKLDTKPDETETEGLKLLNRLESKIEEFKYPKFLTELIAWDDDSKSVFSEKSSLSESLFGKSLPNLSKLGEEKKSVAKIAVNGEVRDLSDTLKPVADFYRFRGWPIDSSESSDAEGKSSRGNETPLSVMTEHCESEDRKLPMKNCTDEVSSRASEATVVDSDNDELIARRSRESFLRSSQSLLELSKSPPATKIHRLKDIRRNRNALLRGFNKSCSDLSGQDELRSPKLVNEFKHSFSDLRRCASLASTYDRTSSSRLCSVESRSSSGTNSPLMDHRKSRTGTTLPFVYGPIPFKSPRRYVEGDITIHYRSPVRTEAKELLSEEELTRRSAENMRRVYQEERRRKYLQELHDIDSRRHTDNFIPSQKSPISLNRYDDFIDDLSSYRSRSQDPTPEPRLVARALYNFVGQSPRELTFRRGDLIFVRRQVDKNWYEGEHNAMVGLFPFNYVEIIPFDGMRTTPKKPYEGQARAKFNFIAQTHLELSLAKGELVVLTRRVDENWYEGRIGNRKGIFPTSYVEVLAEPGNRPETPVQSKPVASPAAHSLLSNGSSGGKLSMGPHHYTPIIPNSNMSQPHYNSLPRCAGNKMQVAPAMNETLHIDTHSEPIPYRALYNYRPQNEDELELKENDTVYVMEKCDDGWYVGSSQRTGYFGTFPGNYVERL